MSIASEIERIKTNIANAYTEIENKGVLFNGTKNSNNLSSAISTIQTGGTGGGPTIEKGFIIDECDSDGYAKEITIKGLTNIPNYMFGAYNYNSPNAITKGLEKVNYAPNTTSIGDYAFSYAIKLSTPIPDTVISIGNYAYRYAALTEVKLHEGLQTIGISAFSTVSTLTTIEIPSTVKDLPNNVFDYCTNVKDVTLHEGLQTIGQRSFGSCSAGLEFINIPSTVTSIGNQAFDGCRKLKTVICNAVTPPTFGTNALRSTAIHNGESGSYIYVPDNSINAYKVATNWSEYAGYMKPLSELPDEYKELI
jgi:hypothetical protein